MTQLTTPKNQKAEVLYELLQHNEVTHLQIVKATGINCPTARIANLRHQHDLNIPCEMRPVRNKHGRTVKIGVWSIPADEKETAIQVYKTLNR